MMGNWASLKWKVGKEEWLKTKINNMCLLPHVLQVPQRFPRCDTRRADSKQGTKLAGVNPIIRCGRMDLTLSHEEMPDKPSFTHVSIHIYKYTQKHIRMWITAKRVDGMSLSGRILSISSRTSMALVPWRRELGDVSAHGETGYPFGNPIWPGKKTHSER